MENALSPLDGRYANKIAALKPYFSEEALNKYRCLVEIKWLITLAQRADVPCRNLAASEIEEIEIIAKDFSADDANKIREIEVVTNHDVKAVEYFLKEKIAKSSLADISEWIHFGLTSEDVNNLAYALMLKDSVEQIILPAVKQLECVLFALASEWKAIPMLARTHGQPASPTTMGKEILIFAARIRRQCEFLEAQQFLGKFAGASGNFNAHVIALPDADWLSISQEFVESFGLTWNPVVAQIEPHDFIAELSHTLSRINTIGIDFARDVWSYISIGFFRQKTKAGEVGSSAMPHKVNPIDFENAEGNFGLANALFGHFAEKLPISRWQRDLTDSTVLRNLGVAFGHLFLALGSLQKGISKLEIAPEAMAADLEKNPEILAEAVQSILRAEGVEKPYEKLKALTRGKQVLLDDFRAFVQDLTITETSRRRLLELTPAVYVGLSAEIVDRYCCFFSK